MSRREAFSVAPVPNAIVHFLHFRLLRKETLFLGRQDAMQRTSLPPIIELSKEFTASSTRQQQQQRPMRVLEVACGTGRFMTFVRDNLPLDTEYTALDLSPFYVQKAIENDNYWRKMRLSEEEKLQQQDRSGRRNDMNQNTVATDILPPTPQKKINPANVVQAQAETLPFEDNIFDAVVCVYLFHELPREIRAKAAAEMARVVSPGGVVVLTDSIQRGDRPPLDDGLSNFQKMNEPYYTDYISDDIGAHFEREGLEPMTKIVRSTTKSLSFSKPGQLNLWGGNTKDALE